jgi:uncharacterized membrane protein
MDAIAVFVEDLWFGAPDWIVGGLIFGGLYVFIGLMVRSRMLAAGLGALAGLVVLSLLSNDFVSFGEAPTTLMGICAGYGAVVAGLTAALRGWAWKQVARWMARRPAASTGAAMA